MDLRLIWYNVKINNKNKNKENKERDIKKKRFKKKKRCWFNPGFWKFYVCMYGKEI